MKKMLMAMAILVLCSPVMASAYPIVPPGGAHEPYGACTGNLIVNGDFESGNTGFDTDYGFLNPTTYGTWTLGPEKMYTIGTNPQNYHSAWTSFGDHTTNASNMMIINASPDANKVVWEQTVAVAPYTNYTFSYWIALSHKDNPPLLETLINGSSIDVYDAATPATSPRIGPTGQWVQVIYPWFSGDATSATIQFVDVTVLAWGDDFVLDDIELCAQAPCTETDLVVGRKKRDKGDIIVTSNGGNIYVTYIVDAPWCFTELHLEVYESFGDAPHNKSGNPIPGKFEYKYYPPEGCAAEYTFELPGELGSGWIAAHAALRKEVPCTDPSATTPCYKTETGWGEGEDLSGANWAMEFEYSCLIPQ